ncbi:MAG: hypothetical protein JNK95_13750 [Candidatus Competibacter sp.]|nr:hypothetical protein [Candidatus Competibacter sp.]MDG4607481.1 hypothetical protein [Candidatus Contendobacter sp.]HRD49317.1 hypothetical protein [Candidatus Contendobacter sp.]
MIPPDLAERVVCRADEIAHAGGTDVTVAIHNWTADTKIVVMEWLNGDDPQREILGSFLQTASLQTTPPTIQLGSFRVAGTHRLSTAFKALQQARADSRSGSWRGTVDGQSVIVHHRPDVGTEESPL